MKTAIEFSIDKPATHNKPDPRKSFQFLKGGRRQGENENPYLAARRTWNDHVGSIKYQRNAWLIVALLCLLIALAGVGGVIYFASQSKLIPYIVEIDKLGQPIATIQIDGTTKTDSRIIRASVAEFISDARTVTIDADLQRKAIFRLYAKLSPNDPATAKMNEWLNGTPDSNPFKRAEKVIVNVDIQSALPQSPATWQIDWVEKTHDRQGVLQGPAVSMRALVTVYTHDFPTEVSDAQLRNNPMNIYMRDFSWSRLQ